MLIAISVPKIEKTEKPFLKSQSAKKRISHNLVKNLKVKVTNIVIDSGIHVQFYTCLWP